MGVSPDAKILAEAINNLANAIREYQPGPKKKLGRPKKVEPEKVKVKKPKHTLDQIRVLGIELLQSYHQQFKEEMVDSEEEPKKAAYDKMAHQIKIISGVKALDEVEECFYDHLHQRFSELLDERK